MAENNTTPVKRNFIRNIARHIKRLTFFLTHVIWEAEIHTVEEAAKKHWIVRATRVVVYTIRGISEHETFIRAAAMTFFSIIAIFPIGGLVYAVLRGVGLEAMLTEQLFIRFPQYSGFISALMQAVSEMLNSTRGVWFMLVSIFFIAWVSVRLFGNIENAFNRIWEVKKKRPFTKKLVSYMVSVVFIPILVLCFMLLTRITRSFISAYIPLPSNIVFLIITLIALWVLFALLFKYIPYTKVKFKYAIIASLLTAVAFMIFQGMYMYIQRGVNAYNIVYGGMAAIPLFLLWVQTSWIILLLGAEVSFSFQNIDSYMQDRNSHDLSVDNRRKITLATMLVISNHFVKNEALVTSDDIAKELKLPLRLIRESIYKLMKSGLIVPVQSSESDKISMYLPAKDIHELTVYGILEAVEESGSSIGSNSPVKEIRNASQWLDNIKLNTFNSESNVKVIDMIRDEGSGNR